MVELDTFRILVIMFIWMQSIGWVHVGLGMGKRNYSAPVLLILWLLAPLILVGAIVTTCILAMINS